jgi:hypothetical protein
MDVIEILLHVVSMHVLAIRSATFAEEAWK